MIVIYHIPILCPREPKKYHQLVSAPDMFITTFPPALPIVPCSHILFSQRHWGNLGPGKKVFISWKGWTHSNGRKRSIQRFGTLDSSSGCDKSTGSESRILRWDLGVRMNNWAIFQINTVCPYYYRTSRGIGSVKLALFPWRQVSFWVPPGVHRGRIWEGTRAPILTLTRCCAQKGVRRDRDACSYGDGCVRVVP